MSAASHHRRLLVVTAIALYGLVLLSFLLFEVPGLGLGHFYYIPVALLALAGGTRIGLLAGVIAAALYALAIALTPRLPTADILTAATAIRLITYCSCGVLIGWFANQHRGHLEQLRELAERDFLTGFFNKRMFDEVLARRCSSTQPFVLVLGDMDNLKLVNDTHGHTAGNAELRRLASTLSATVRPDDELARVGGDEFAILTSTPVEKAGALCAELRTALAAEDIHITFGWAASPDDGFGALELFRKADDRLYAAKLIQRNHHVVEQLTRAAAAPLGSN